MNVKAQIIKGKVSILGVVALWGDCMDIPTDLDYSNMFVVCTSFFCYKNKRESI
jgi:hypothetical protein